MLYSLIQQFKGTLLKKRKYRNFRIYGDDEQPLERRFTNCFFFFRFTLPNSLLLFIDEIRNLAHATEISGNFKLR